MSNILDQQQEMMKRILDFIEQEKEKLNTLYSECITKMNDSNPNKQVYDNIDELHKSCYGEKDAGSVSDIKYWYDMNKKQFIEPIENYDGVSYKEYNFEIYLSQHLFHKESVRNKISIPIKSINIDGIVGNQAMQNLNSFHTDGKHFIINDILITYGKANNNGGIGEIASTQHIVVEKRYVNGQVSLSFDIKSAQPNNKINLQIDNYLNIYIPAIETLIVNNYIKFPQYVLDSQYHKYFNKSECVVLNPKNYEDTKAYNLITNGNGQFTNYLTSKDRRELFNDGKLFQDILDFLDYDEMLKDVKLYLDFSSKLRVYGKEDEKFKKDKEELELKTKLIESKDTEIERLKLELKELRQFYINS